MNGATGAYGTAAVLVATAMGAARVILLANPEPSTHGPGTPVESLTHSGRQPMTDAVEKGVEEPGER